MATRLIPYYVQVTDYDNTGETTLAGTLSGATANSVFIFNTTTGKARVWNGSAFADLTYDPLAIINTAIVAGYRTILATSGSHTAAKVAGTYALGCGDPLAVSGTGILYPQTMIHLVAADYPTVNGLAPKLRIRAQLYPNDVAPFTGTFVIGLYPVTRPATSGGTGVCIYTLGTVVSGSTATFTNPAADGLLAAVGSDFALPSDGHYTIGCVTNQTMATNAHAHINVQLQIRNA